MPIRWTASADKRGIPTGEVLFAMTNPHIYVPEFDEAGGGEAGFADLWIGPAYVGGPLLEVMARRDEPDLIIFHVMRARETTIRRAKETLDDREED